MILPIWLQWLIFISFLAITGIIFYFFLSRFFYATCFILFLTVIIFPYTVNPLFNVTGTPTFFVDWVRFSVAILVKIYIIIFFLFIPEHRELDGIDYTEIFVKIPMLCFGLHAFILPVILFLQDTLILDAIILFDTNIYQLLVNPIFDSIAGFVMMIPALLYKYSKRTRDEIRKDIESTEPEMKELKGVVY